MEVQQKIPQKKSVVIIAILSLITIGLYPFIWFIKRVDELNNLNTSTKLKKSTTLIQLVVYFILILLAISMVSLVAINPSKYPSEITSISEIPVEFLILIPSLFIVSIILGTFIFLTGFKIRKILNEALINKGENVKISGFYTFIFSFLYLQYEINRIIDDKEKNKRIGPLIWFIIIFLQNLIGLIIFAFIFLGLSSSISSQFQLP